MKNKLITAGVALFLATLAQAEQILYTNVLEYEAGDIRWVYAKDGSYAASANGYIATYWFGTSANDLRIIGADVMGDQSQWLGPGCEGMFWTAAVDCGDILASTQYYTEVRIWKEKDGLLSEADVAGMTMGYLNGRWNYISGESIDVEYGSYGAPVRSTDGAFIVVTEMMPPYPSELRMGVNSGGQVPEPSTYAALAGLAILAYVAIRRRK